jgi:hypothetical protein
LCGKNIVAFLMTNFATKTTTVAEEAGVVVPSVF